MKTIGDTPIVPLLDIKKSPMSGFDLAQQEAHPVYVTRWNEVVGVVMTQDQYEELVEKAAKYETYVENRKS